MGLSVDFQFYSSNQESLLIPVLCSFHYYNCFKFETWDDDATIILNFDFDFFFVQDHIGSQPLSWVVYISIQN